MKFQGKSAVVTGAASGIGFATAKQLAEGGANVLLVDYDRKKLVAATASLSHLPGRIISFVCDVSDEPAVYESICFAENEFGRIDILVNNAGIYRDICVPFIESDSSMWKQKINVNILGTMYYTRAVIKGMISNGYGRIINITSVAGVYGIANMTDYSMTKGAIIGFTKALAKEVTPQGVLVNAVAPGSIGDPKQPTDLSFLNRCGSCEEAANLICFLASDEASYISGQNYQIDGCRKKM